MTSRETQLLSGPEAEGNALLPRPLAWALPLPPPQEIHASHLEKGSQ